MSKETVHFWLLLAATFAVGYFLTVIAFWNL